MEEGEERNKKKLKRYIHISIINIAPDIYDAGDHLHPYIEVLLCIVIAGNVMLTL